MIPADSTGTSRKNPWRLVWAASGSQCLAYRTIIPIAVSTPASPALKAINKINPSTALPSAMELNSSTRAEGHGAKPPLAPSAIRLARVISPSGT